MYLPPYVEPLPVVTPPEPRCECGGILPHASACAFSIDPEAT